MEHTHLFADCLRPFRPTQRHDYSIDIINHNLQLDINPLTSTSPTDIHQVYSHTSLPVHLSLIVILTIINLIMTPASIYLTITHKRNFLPIKENPYLTLLTTCTH